MNTGANASTPHDAASSAIPFPTSPAAPFPTLVDTHCHIDAKQFENDPPEAVIERALRVGVRRMVNIGTNLETSAAAVELAQAQARVYAAVGVDPNDAEGFDEASISRLRSLASRPKVVAIGEIGLDYHWDVVARDEQARVFRVQLDLACELGLPVVIHNRDADEDTGAILIEWASSPAVKARFADRPVGVMHCYSGDLDLAQRLHELGFLISLAGVVTFKNARALQAVAKEMPVSALVIETDAPYLSPHPHRGERNEPARVRNIAEFVAGLREDALEEIARATTRNAASLFGWDPPELWPET
jgi:TatD DNase family protein